MVDTPKNDLDELDDDLFPEEITKVDIEAQKPPIWKPALRRHIQMERLVAKIETELAEGMLALAEMAGHPTEWDTYAIDLLERATRLGRIRQRLGAMGYKNSRRY